MRNWDRFWARLLEISIVPTCNKSFDLLYYVAFINKQALKSSAMWDYATIHGLLCFKGTNFCGRCLS